MIERHYDDETLIAMAEGKRVGSDAHLQACTECGEKLESYGMIADALRDEAVWKDGPLCGQPSAATIAKLRAFADRMADEDAQAEQWVAELLAGPRDGWRAKLGARPEYRTAGTVRKLLEASERAIDTMPPDAVAITALAVDIAEHLDPAAYPGDTVARLRGAAWRDRAYALFYTGHYSDADRVISRSYAAVAACNVNEYERARIGIVSGLISRVLEQFDRALLASRESAEVFQQHGDRTRWVSAKSAEAGVLAHTNRYTEALALWLELDRGFDVCEAGDARARVLGNIAYAYRHLGRIEDAVRYYQLSSDAFAVLGNRSEAARLRWNIAAILAESGKYDEAIVALTQLRNEFRTLGIINLGVVVALDLAELLVVCGRPDEVLPICASVMDELSKAGEGYTESALRAIAHMQEAVSLGRVTPQLVKGVRDYVRRLPEEPQLLFLAPPESR